MNSNNVLNRNKHWINSHDAGPISSAALAKFQNESASSWSRPGLIVRAGGSVDHFSAIISAHEFVSKCAIYESSISWRNHENYLHQKMRDI
jgi:hypothetical protein